MYLVRFIWDLVYFFWCLDYFVYIVLFDDKLLVMIKEKLIRNEEIIDRFKEGRNYCF